MNSPCTNSRGFTLLDLSISISLAALIGTLGMSSLKTALDNTSVQAEVDKVRDALTKAGDIARARLQCVSVKALPNAVEITPYTTCQPALSGPLATERVDLGSQVSLSDFSTGGDLTFSPRGGTLAGGASTLTLTTRAGKTYVYRVLPAIGTVRVQ